MALSAIVLVATGTLLALSMLITRILHRKKSSLRLPPGPRPLPIVGNLLSFMKARSPEEQAKLTNKWIGKYGPIITTWFGDRCIIVVASADIAKEALINSGHQFSSRLAPHSGVQFLNSIGFRMISSSPDHSYWRYARSNLVNHLAHKGTRQALQSIREEELAWILDTMRTDAKDGAAPLQIRQYVRRATCSMVFRLCFGKRCSKSTLEELNNTLDDFLKEMTFRLADVLPHLGLFTRTQPSERLEFYLRRLREIVEPLIMEHRELREKGEFLGDYVDKILNLQDDVGLSENDILGLVTELHFGGIDTTSQTMEWIMAELITNPEVQQRLFEQIKQVAGNRPVVEDDIQNLPYLRAIVQEGLRKNPPLPNLVTHAASKAGSKLAGYDIPETALLRFAAMKIQNDQCLWNEPEAFKPERFLDADGQFLDMLGAQRQFMIFPFGAGRRICPGMNMAIRMLQMMTARLVQTFRFLPVDPEKGIDFSQSAGNFSILYFKTPVQAIIEDRKLF